MKAYIFDTETDSAQQDARVIEAAWIQAGDSPACVEHADNESWCERYNPLRPIGLGAMAVHNIIDADLTDCAPYTDFALPSDTEYLIGHQIDFDWGVIGSPKDIKLICTLALSRRLWPEIETHKQVALMYHLLPHAEAQQLVKNAHSALADVQMCKLLLIHILKELASRNYAVETWETLWQLSEKARIPTHMLFGKHKGSKINDLPSDYVRWFLGQPDIDPYLRKALEKVGANH